MCKTKPVSTWNCDKELIVLEKDTTNPVLGQLTLWNTLKRRNANCLNFNQDGDLLCAGTDGRHIIVWNWAKNRTLTNYRPDIKGKISQIKFIDSAGSLDIVSASYDGQMLGTIVPPSGGAPMSSHCLYTHSGCVADFEIVPRSRHEILSAGDYGIVKFFDLRSSSAATTDANSYDKPDITSAVYNHSGNELLACYRRTGNCLFDSRNYTDGDFFHYYRKHYGDFNGKYFWDKNTEEILCENMDEKAKTAICLKPHPWKPMLATAALIKPGIHIWIPNGPIL
ncbi:DDB1- and CUL4-associated factor 8-like [Drosophila suzukii]|uniref:DDB1- and CUL4-associated factor 8-like n=1 Tax=Drosophila suzukii TaxID=28584 RepID=A0ABM4TSX6_DROSZ